MHTHAHSQTGVWSRHNIRHERGTHTHTTRHECDTHIEELCVDLLECKYADCDLALSQGLRELQ